ncbi:uncharacterized protein MYCFIDRAFT_215597 [Pseudocercospora fijiensis CIRAD86]|uniref:ubiquitinyl hydrolase 1 n=1 Tax=Pseudocercospora fijiensis (strain CIRAD86) TaxID=383855 RepID=M3AC73_PSEFD|nr:uncharacterized protein MYCFIDRAFT_215597 [Pseudocercospora fijiensis CIRAD86]EME82161.1 hypothetical protein MYCFIDRAFT_215597 [Pseudocercospora fijiensis CIRAD86]
MADAVDRLGRKSSWSFFAKVASLYCCLRRLMEHLQQRKSDSSPAKHVHRPEHFGSIFTIEDDPKAKPDKDEERQIKGVLERLRSYGINTMVESNAKYALRITHGGAGGEQAFRLLMLLQETYEGIVKPYQPTTKLVGAVNRDSVTCYLDALLFAMFARLDSFEAMLYDNFEDVPRKKLAGLLRLWVNMLRTGRLITVDITKHIQNALAECGWPDAIRLKQQDPSEAFTFITGQLGLPLLTLKMDLYHTGKEEPQDDHKFINERLLEVAILDEPVEGSSVITLEDCLEHYFNNRIEVKRHLENQRRNTLKSAELHSVEDLAKVKKESGLHVEVAEIAPSTTGTPIVQTPISEMSTPITPSYSRDPIERLRPTAGRRRGDSIFSQRKVEVLEGWDPEKNNEDHGAPQEVKERKMSTRTEVLMPAWQFFKLLPWYTDHMPTSDAQVAAHFSKKRPVLGICLKRYSYTNTGQAQRRDTYVDIPLEIAVPNFVSDENMDEGGPLVGNFRLLLQSVVCHRGMSVNSGHYVCLSRGTAANAVSESHESSRRGSLTDSEDVEDPWMRFDDLSSQRVTDVDIHEALRQETPYLLFYQVQPIGDDGHSIHNLPSYEEATSRSQSDLLPLEEKPYLDSGLGSENTLEKVPSQALSEGNQIGSDTVDWEPGSGRPSLEISTTVDGPRGRCSIDDRRRSITFDDASVFGSIRTDPTGSVPSTPAEEQPNALEKNGNSFLAVANKLSGSRRGSRQSKGGNSKSRPTSTGLDSANNSRFSLNLNMSKLTQKISRNDNNGAFEMPADEPQATATVLEVTDTKDEDPGGITPRHSEAHTRDHSQDVEKAAMGTLNQTSLQPAHAKTHSMSKKRKQAAKEKRRKTGQDDRDCSVM